MNKKPVILTHRQRALIALSGGEPDFVPTFELIFDETERDFEGRTLFGCHFSDRSVGLTKNDLYKHNARLYLDIARKFEHSIIYVSPLDWPFISHYDDVTQIIRLLRDMSGDEFCIMAPGDPTFKIPSNPQAFCERIYDDPEGLKVEAQAKVDALIPIYDKLIAAGADGFILTSDYAMNSGTFLSPSQFAEFITPYLSQAVKAIKNCGAVCIKHSDGNLMSVIDQIIEAAPHGLHSIDPMAGMDIKLIKERYGTKICLCGNVHCAWMQTGTAEQIESSAKYCLKYGKPGGGYIFSTSNCVFRGMPLESYDIIHKIWKTNRDY